MMYLYSLFSTFVCTTLAYGYPAWASFKAVDSEDPLLHTQWLVYWIVIAVFTVFEMLLENILSWLPFYYEAKMCFIAWLVLPQFKGATKLYVQFVSPTLEKYEEHIDRHIDNVRRRASSKFGEVASDGLDFITSKGVEVLAMAKDVAATANKKDEKEQPSRARGESDVTL